MMNNQLYAQIKTTHRGIALYPFVLVPIFMWVGFVSAISFMEAWLKFQAPNISLSIGLGIGKLVFAALNKTEWGFAGVIIGLIVANKGLWHRTLLSLYTAILILVLQTVYLLPLLNERAEKISQGLDVLHSHIHVFYVSLEVVKVISLLILGITIIFDLSRKRP